MSHFQIHNVVNKKNIPKITMGGRNHAHMVGLSLGCPHPEFTSLGAGRQQALACVAWAGTNNPGRVAGTCGCPTLGDYIT